MSRATDSAPPQDGIILVEGGSQARDRVRGLLEDLVGSGPESSHTPDGSTALAALEHGDAFAFLVDPQGASQTTWQLLHEAERRGYEIPLLCLASRRDGAHTGPDSAFVDATRPLPSIYYDSLTALPNRHLFTEWLTRAIARVEQQPGYRFAVLLLDLDRFKIINDSLGHQIGDRLLIRIARRLLAHLRFSDAVARVSGDEFTILLDDVKDVSDAVRIAERVHAALKDPFHVGGQEVFPTVSIGIALSETGYDRPDEMLQDAETAMYRAKKSEAGYEIFDPAMRGRARDILRLQSDLRRAVERDEFLLHYQPIVNMPSGKLLGFEALIRWNHPERGFVSPGEFISVAEETGQIVPIGEWVLGEACRQLVRWHAGSPKARELTMNVNFSRKQLREPQVVARVDSILQRTGLDPAHLSLEITESMVMEDTESAVTTLKQLRDLGLSLCVDDFGTGYSSLSCLHSLPIQTIKIDRGFVSRMGMDVESSEIVRTIVSLARNLNKKVVAEGVETADQLARLEALGCDQAQGFYFSRPVPTDQAGELIQQQFLAPAALTS